MDLALLVASPLILSGLLLIAAWVLANPPRCGVCGAALPWRDWPARTCEPCLQRWRLAERYGARAAWMEAVGAAHEAGLHGQALRDAVDAMLINREKESRQRAA